MIYFYTKYQNPTSDCSSLIVITVKQIRFATQGYSKWLSGFSQLVIHNTLQIAVLVFFLFNCTLQVFVTYLTAALYVHPLWFYKHQNDSRVRSKLFVPCQRWWFQWRFWFVPSAPGYLREEECNKNLECCSIKKKHILLSSQVYCVWQVVKTPTIISNNPVYKWLGLSLLIFSLLQEMFTVAICFIYCNINVGDYEI
jgi:hypothetical protein